MALSAPAFIHSSVWPSASHTGMRSWISAATPLLSPVMTVKVAKLSSPSSLLASSHSPATHSGVAAWMNQRSFFPSSGLTDHSLYPAIGLRQRLVLSGLRNAGFVATASMRALMVEPCSPLAFAQNGSRPQASRCTCRPSPGPEPSRRAAWAPGCSWPAGTAGRPPAGGSPGCQRLGSGSGRIGCTWRRHTPAGPVCSWRLLHRSGANGGDTPTGGLQLDAARILRAGRHPTRATTLRIRETDVP